MNTQTFPRISIKGISKRFDTATKQEGYLALRDVDLEVEGSEFISLVGRSGCGKSTLLRIVAGLLKPSSGSVYIGDKLVTAPTRRVGVVFQSPTLLPWFSLLDNVLLPHRIAGTLDQSARERAEELLAITGLADHRMKYPRELSGGMQQRGSIARALVTSPDVLLMDEPFSAVDEFTRESLNDELMRIWSHSKTTILFVTHNIGEAVYLSDRIVVMDTGPGRISGVLNCPVSRPRTQQSRTTDSYYQTITAVRETLVQGTGEARPAADAAAPQFGTGG